MSTDRTPHTGRPAGHDAVTGTSRSADAERIYGLDAEHHTCRASRLSRRIRGDDDRLLGIDVAGRAPVQIDEIRPRCPLWMWQRKE
jgi:hypothetical protein